MSTFARVWRYDNKIVALSIIPFIHPRASTNVPPAHYRPPACIPVRLHQDGNRRSANGNRMVGLQIGILRKYKPSENKLNYSANRTINSPSPTAVRRSVFSSQWKLKLPVPEMVVRASLGERVRDAHLAVSGMNSHCARETAPTCVPLVRIATAPRRPWIVPVKTCCPSGVKVPRSTHHTPSRSRGLRCISSWDQKRPRTHMTLTKTNTPSTSPVGLFTSYSPLTVMKMGSGPGTGVSGVTLSWVILSARKVIGTGSVVVSSAYEWSLCG